MLMAMASGAAPLAGVVLEGLPDNPVTGDDGRYEAIVPAGWTGTATPTLSSYAFVPPSRTYAAVGSDLPAQDYAASISAATITVVFPDGGEALKVGRTYAVTWSWTGQIANVRIEYSLDSGLGWLTMAASELNSGSYSWFVPSSPSSTCLVRVSDAANPAVFDVSDGLFRIVVSEDFVGTWDGQGVYYRNSDSGAWVKLASPANMIATGDLDGDGIDDLIGLWPTQGGIWVKYSATGLWAKLSSTAVHIAAGDMNGDGREDLLGTWDGQGVYYRNSLTGAWVRMASPATLITTGDLDGDDTDDLVGIWPTQGGVWVKYSATGLWARLSSTARDIACGDMNGDGRDDLLATWDGQGVYYRDSMTGAWVKMASEATQVTCGDLDADGTPDLLGIWPTQGGVWAKYSSTSVWARLSSTAQDITAGVMRAQGLPEASATASEEVLVPEQAVEELPLPMGGTAEGPETAATITDLSDDGPGGLRFVYLEEKGLEPKEAKGEGMSRIPGPGEQGFVWVEQKNTAPREVVRDKKN